MTTNTPWIVTRVQLRNSVLMVGGYWAIMLFIYAVIVSVVLATGDTDVSIWATSAGSAPKYFLLAVGVMQTGAQLPLFVGNGVTRRDFALGGSTYVLAVAAVYAVIMTLGFGVEYPLYSSAHLLGGLDDPYPVQSVADALSMFVGELFVGIAYLCCGWLLGTCFYRLGNWWGIALIPVVVLPAVVTEVGFDALWIGYGINRALGIERPPLGVGVLMAAAAIAVAWVINFALIRAVSIKKISG